jgi:hypothetical protein
MTIKEHTRNIYYIEFTWRTVIEEANSIEAF